MGCCASGRDGREADPPTEDPRTDLAVLALAGMVSALCAQLAAQAQAEAEAEATQTQTRAEAEPGGAPVAKAEAVAEARRARSMPGAECPELGYAAAMDEGPATAVAAATVVATAVADPR